MSSLIQEADGFLYDSLSTIRNRLLDLTSRNKLINYRHGRRSIRFVDVCPDELFKVVISEKPIAFTAVPEPSQDDLKDESGETQSQIPLAINWAKQLGINTNFDLTDSSEKEKIVVDDEENKPPKAELPVELQVLMYPYEMETLLRKVRSIAETAIEESGANVLYLVFGFLEWTESKSSSIARQAPLCVVPVTINRGKLNPTTGTVDFTLSYGGEDLFSNLSLFEKMRRDFGLILPEFNEKTTPIDYMTEVARLLRINQPEWKVKNQCTLALLNFSKLHMYLDLDTKRWPEGDSNIINHPIVSKFLGGANNNEDEKEGISFQIEHDIDELHDVHQEFPVIADADSSQHSALVDVVRGKNIVIEGPPGTGKSQTITNIIAAALAKNKKVLFVAEKMAALEVVKSRLNNAGLGDFCLELHSHKVQKRKVLDSIQQRLNNQEGYKAPEDFGLEIDHYESIKSELTSYVSLINRPCGNTGYSLHEVLNKASRYRDEYKEPLKDIVIEDIDSTTFNKARQAELSQAIDLYVDMYKQVAKECPNGDLTQHYWYGAESITIQPFEINSVVSQIKSINVSLEKILNDFDLLREQYNLPSELSLESFSDMKRLVSNLSLLPDAKGDELFDLLDELLDSNNLDAFKATIRIYSSIHRLYKNFFDAIELNYDDDLGKISEAARYFIDINIGNFNLDSINEIFLTLKQLDLILDKITAILISLREALPKTAENNFNCTQSGLSELKTFIRLASELDSSCLNKRDVCFNSPDIDENISKLKNEVLSIEEQGKTLSEYFNIENLPDIKKLTDLYNVVNNKPFFAFLDRQWRTAKKTIKSLMVNTDFNQRLAIEKLNDAIEFAKAKRELSENSHYQSIFKNMFKGFDTDIVMLEKMSGWYKSIRSEYGLGFGKRAVIGSALFSMDSLILQSLQDLKNQKDYDSIGEAVKLIESLPSGFNNGLFKDKDAEINENLKKILKSMSPHVEDVLALIKSGEFSPAYIFDLCNSKDELKALKERWEGARYTNHLQNSKINLSLEPLKYCEEVEEVAFRTIKIVETVSYKGQKIKSLVSSCKTHTDYNKQFDLLNKLNILNQKIQKNFKLLEVQADINLDLWLNNHEQLGINDLIERNKLAVNHPNTLNSLIDFYRISSNLDKLGLGALSEAVQAGKLNIYSIKNAFFCFSYDILARELLDNYPKLSVFSGKKQNFIIEEFKRVDQKLYNLQCQRIAYSASRVPVPRGHVGRHASDRTELSLLQHEISKKKKHIAIRQLIHRAGEAITTLKPCFMMGPMSVAQYLDPASEIQFDLVVMDEASQMRPEDALGAIARGRQIVIVGDPKQLPPTNFFSKSIEEDTDGDIAAIEECESILDSAMPLFQLRQLRWHYRSRHESLIAFSNQYFYDSNLVVFPSPYAKTNNFGVKLTRVDGCFEQRRNILEAKAIVDEVVNHILRSSDSIGIVAMNSEQREQIEGMIEQRAKDNIEFREMLDKNREEAEHLFVKNLENVQGDERDVIIISCTYGPAIIGGKVAQRFGPINGEDGWRRLNVLFTRSKKRMHVFSSMGAEDILTTPSSKRGVIALKDFLAYAETGYIHQPLLTGKEPDSDFEIAVASRLRNKGYECEYQVGVAGYFIDLAIKDPKNPGKFIACVECDGATYHSAKSARDRDRLRQQILEGLGWKIFRIWSTDWFKNPEGEIRSLLHSIKDSQKSD